MNGHTGAEPGRIADMLDVVFLEIRHVLRDTPPHLPREMQSLFAVYDALAAHLRKAREDARHATVSLKNFPEGLVL